MEPWQLWQDMARESEQAGRLAEDGGCPRSAASRYYYAAYQAATALLLYRHLTPPEGREAWGHFDTPALLQDQLRALTRSADLRNDLTRRLRELYRLRLDADYSGLLPVVAGQAAAAGKDSRSLLGVVDKFLPKGVTP